MSYIFNALEQARREKHNAQISSYPIRVTDTDGSSKSHGLSDLSTDVDIVNMFRRINEQLNEDKWVLQVVSVQAGEGVSFVAKRLARVSAELLNKKTLLVNLVRCSIEVDDEFSRELNWEEVTQKLEAKATASVASGCNVLVEVSMPFIPCFKHVKETSNSFSEIKKRYDIIIVDTPSTAIEPNSVEFSRYVDVVLIVLEAERTKIFAVQSLRDKVKHISDAFLGIILNKRCFHIPYALYSKLH